MNSVRRSRVPGSASTLPRDVLTARWVDIALGLAALATSTLTLLTAVIGVAVAVRELRRNTRITEHAATAAHATQAILTDVVHNGGVADPQGTYRGSDPAGYTGGGGDPTQLD